ncbi:hypothetical protein [Terribacillus halophilus]|jgi:hypothetical protein|uniref:hypothetical protein n=1 Tax=Terribacillus halophilus TaxID=361279 RepID=UPI000986C54F|nr:hypothetical protein [Terribacillus halophilus]
MKKVIGITVGAVLLSVGLVFSGSSNPEALDLQPGAFSTKNPTVLDLQPGAFSESNLVALDLQPGAF